MKKVLMLLMVGMVLMSAVPSLWTTPPEIKGRCRCPLPVGCPTCWDFH
jgi:hypothetical protein